MCSEGSSYVTITIDTILRSPPILIELLGVEFKQFFSLLKDEYLSLEEIETSHTQGGVGRYYTVVIHT